MFVFFNAILWMVVLGAVVGAYYQGRSDGFGAHEVAAQARALEVSEQSLATSERLRKEGDADAAKDREEADVTIALVREAAAEATAEAEAEADAHAARAQDAEDTAGRALAMVDEMKAKECPGPDPDEPCPWTCVLPKLPG